MLHFSGTPPPNRPRKLVRFICMLRDCREAERSKIRHTRYMAHSRCSLNTWFLFFLTSSFSSFDEKRLISGSEMSTYESEAIHPEMFFFYGGPVTLARKVLLKTLGSLSLKNRGLFLSHLTSVPNVHDATP